MGRRTDNADLKSEDGLGPHEPGNQRKQESKRNAEMDDRIAEIGKDLPVGEQPRLGKVEAFRILPRAARCC